MPHNRTRLWVGLAIIAVTIPAVGQYLYRSNDRTSQAQALLKEARWNATTTRGETRSSERRLAKSGANRNYLAEVDAAIGRRGTVFADGQAYPYDNGPDYAYDSGPAAPEYPAADYRDLEDQLFDIDPLNGPLYTDDRAPAPAAFMAPDPAFVDPQINADEEEIAMAQDDASLYAGGLTDDAIYTTVMNNLSADDRDEFVRAWTAMTPDQRADLLDGWRQNMQGGTP